MAKKAQRTQLAQLKRWKQQKPHSPSLSPEARYTFEYLKEETQELIEDPAFQREHKKMLELLYIIKKWCNLRNIDFDAFMRAPERNAYNGLKPYELPTDGT